MNDISFDDFYRAYRLKRNPVSASSAYENTLIDFDDEGEEIVEEENPHNVWTLIQKDKDFILSPGITYTRDVIGFFTCKQKWTKEKGYILV